MKKPTSPMRLRAAIIVLAGFLVAGHAWAQAPSPIVDGETIATPELVAAACSEGAVTYYTAQSDGDERAII